MEFHSNQHLPEELVDATKGPFLRKSIEKSPFEARFYGSPCVFLHLHSNPVQDEI